MIEIKLKSGLVVLVRPEDRGQGELMRDLLDYYLSSYEGRQFMSEILERKAKELLDAGVVISSGTC